MSKRVIIDEIEVEVPYGKLSAKTWHEETDECKRILALHGWMDNSGSFDNLMPNLTHKDGLYIVAIDLPGHGRSSQLPPGSSYSDLNIVMEVRRCLFELDWIQPIKLLKNSTDKNSTTNSNNSNSIDISGASCCSETNNGGGGNKKKFTIIGHSLGAGIGLFYASLYPDDVEEIILLDFLKSRTMPADMLLDDVAETINKFLITVPSQSPFSSPAVQAKFGNLKNPDKGQVIVSQETAIIATINAHKQLGNLTRNDAICLLKRSTVAVSTPPNSVIYSRDLRLQAMLNLREHVNINKIMFSRLRCHMLSVLTKQGLYVENELFKNDMDTMEEFYRKITKSFNIQWLDGDHYIHMNQPKKTADLINKYLAAPQDFSPFKDQGAES